MKSDRMASKSKNPYAVIDLFSGVGGFSLGASRAGFKIACALDIDPHASSAHLINFPKTAHIQKDIRFISSADILSAAKLHAEDITGVIGGPPCQGFSFMGRSAPRDIRNDLYVHFFRLVSELNPQFFFAENVPGILQSKYDRIRKKGLDLVSKKYTILSPLIVSAHKFGAPTSRKRIFFFGIRKDLKRTFLPSEFDPPKGIEPITVKTALTGLRPKLPSTWTDEKHSWRKTRHNGSGYFSSRLHGLIPPGVGNKEAILRLKKQGLASGFLGTEHTTKVLRRFAQVKQGNEDTISRCHRLSPSGFCPTLRAGTGSERGSYQAVRPLHPTQHRVISPREAARLQGFPDWFQFSPTRWHSFRQIGNSVSPLVAERLLRIVKNKLNSPIQQKRKR